MARRSDSSCRQCRGARHVCPAGPARATMILPVTGTGRGRLRARSLPACGGGPSRTSRPDEARRAARRLPSAGVHACTPSCGGLRPGSGPGQLRSRAGARGEGEDVADGRFLAGRFGQRQVRLDLVAVAAAVFLFHHIAGFGEVGDDAVGAALGDAQAGRDVAQSRARVMGDVQQHPGVAGQETPARHPLKPISISRNLLLVSNCGCRLRADTGISRRRRPRCPGVTGGSRP